LFEAIKTDKKINERDILLKEGVFLNGSIFISILLRFSLFFCKKWLKDLDRCESV
jgi:hypothetical protein